MRSVLPEGAELYLDQGRAMSLLGGYTDNLSSLLGRVALGVHAGVYEILSNMLVLAETEEECQVTSFVAEQADPKLVAKAFKRACAWASLPACLAAWEVLRSSNIGYVEKSLCFSTACAKERTDVVGAILQTDGAADPKWGLGGRGAGASGKTGVLKLLIDCGKLDPEDGLTLRLVHEGLARACREGHAGVFDELMVWRDAALSQHKEQASYQLNSLLEEAIKFNQTEMINKILPRVFNPYLEGCVVEAIGVGLNDLVFDLIGKMTPTAEDELKFLEEAAEVNSGVLVGILSRRDTPERRAQAMEKAIASGNTDSVKILLDHPEVARTPEELAKIRMRKRDKFWKIGMIWGLLKKQPMHPEYVKITKMLLDKMTTDEQWRWMKGRKLNNVSWLQDIKTSIASKKGLLAAIGEADSKNASDEVGIAPTKRARKF